MWLAGSFGSVPQSPSQDLSGLLKVVQVALPAILAALFAWLSSQRKEVRRSADLQRLTLRVELVEKLKGLYADTTIDRTSSLAQEAADILADLEALRTGEGVRVGAAAGISWVAAAFLAYKQRSWKGAMYRVFFWGFLGFGTLMLLGIGVDPNIRSTWSVYLVSAAVYIGIALAFRQAAVRDYIGRSEKERIARESRPSGLPGGT